MVGSIYKVVVVIGPSGSVKSTFLANIDKLFASALTVPEIAGVIINPWNRTIQLDKNLIQIIEGAKR